MKISFEGTEGEFDQFTRDWSSGRDARLKAAAQVVDVEERAKAQLAKQRAKVNAEWSDMFEKELAIPAKDPATGAAIIEIARERDAEVAGHARREAVRKARVEAELAGLLMALDPKVPQSSLRQLACSLQFGLERLERDQPAASEMRAPTGALRQAWPNSEPAKCEECGWNGGWYGGHRPTCSKAKPSPTTEAPETILETRMPDGSIIEYTKDMIMSPSEALGILVVAANHSAAVSDDTPWADMDKNERAAQIIRDAISANADVVEKRVAEGSVFGLKTVREVLGAGEQEGVVPAARRVVAERDTALARVRELEGQRNELLATKEEHRERAETAERERDGAKAKAALWDQVADAVRSGMGWEVKP